jgi:hypothetical protein
MQLTKFLTLLFSVTCYTTFSQLPTEVTKSVDGFIIYTSEIVHDSVPQDVIFFPYEIDTALNLRVNFTNFLEKKARDVGYFMYFKNMRHTQPYVYNHLKTYNRSIDTSKYLIRTRLKNVCMGMNKLKSYSLAFPSLVDPFDSETVVSFGVILYEEYGKNEGYQNIRKFSINFDNKTYELSYKDLGNEYGTRKSFLPFIFKE